MTDPLSPTRLDALLAGDAPRDDVEARTLALCTALRTEASEPSHALRARARAIASRAEAADAEEGAAGDERAGTGAARRAPAHRRRLIPAVAVACVAACALVVAGGVTLRDATTSGQDVAASSGATAEAPAGREAAPDAREASPDTTMIAPAPSVTDSGTGARLDARTAEMTLAVADEDALLSAVDVIVTATGRREGYVEQVDARVGAQTASAIVTVMVPDAEAAGLLADAARLGDVQAQALTQADRGPAPEAGDAAAIVRLRRERARLMERLLDAPGDVAAQERLARVEARLAMLEARAANAADPAVRFTRATFTIRIADGTPSRLERARAQLGDLAGDIGIAALYGAFVLAPVALLAAIVFAVWRARRRRWWN